MATIILEGDINRHDIIRRNSNLFRLLDARAFKQNRAFALSACKLSGCTVAY